MPEASVSARLMDFRKARFGSHYVDQEYVLMGLWKYRLTVNLIAYTKTTDLLGG